MWLYIKSVIVPPLFTFMSSSGICNKVQISVYKITSLNINSESKSGSVVRVPAYNWEISVWVPAAADFLCDLGKVYLCLSSLSEKQDFPAWKEDSEDKYNKEYDMHRST